jgi:hypothetical protein
MVGFYSVLDKLKAELIASPFVNTVTEGSIFEVDLNKQTIFPLSHIMVNNVTVDQTVLRFNISIIAMDIVDISKSETTDVFRGNDNEQDVLNTQLAVCQRLAASMYNGALSDLGYEIETSPSCEPFTERFENLLAGWTMTFDLVVPNEMSICDEVAEPVISVYSQVLNFNVRPRTSLPNSCRYKCNGITVDTKYGVICDSIGEFVDMLNSNPPVQPNGDFYVYGTYYDNGDGRVRLQMPLSVYDEFCPDGIVTIEVFND